MNEDRPNEPIQDWDTFYEVYYAFILEAFRRYVGPDRAEELTQAFFLKLMEKQFLARLPELGDDVPRFLSRMIHNWAMDGFRDENRRAEVVDEYADRASRASAGESASDAEDPDADYALNCLHLTLQQMRHHCETTGKPEILRRLTWQTFAGPANR